MALVQLLALIAGELVDDAPAFHRRPGIDLLRPAVEMLIFVRGEEFVRARIGAA